MDSICCVSLFPPRVARVLTLITLLVFSSSSMAQGGFSFNPPANPTKAPPSIRLEPSRLVSVLAGTGKIRQENLIPVSPLAVSRDTSPLIIHIQDAHANYSAQKNIAQVIEKITEEFRKAAAADGRDPETLQIGIAVEGFEGAPDFSTLSKLPKNEIQRQAAGFFMKQAFITGAEYEIFAAGKNHHYFGVDANEFLNRDVELYLSVLRKTQAIEPVLKGIAVKIAQEEHKMENRHLQLFYANQRDAEEDQEKYLDYLQFLFKEIGRNPKRAGSLENILMRHREINSAKLETEIKRAGREWRKLSALKLLFFPNLRKQLEYEKEISRLDLDQWMRELPELELAAKQKLITNAEERQLDVLIEGFSLIRQLVELELSPEKWNAWLFRRAEILAAFQKWTDRRGSWEKLFRVIELAEAFYLIAKYRDRRMVENLLGEVQKRKLDFCFLVAGGFHSKGLAENLALTGQHYIVVSPLIESLSKTEKELYRLRLNGDSQVLASTVWERYFAAGDQVIPAFVQMVNAAPKSGIGSGFINAAYPSPFPLPIRERISVRGQEATYEAASRQSFSKLTAGVPTFDRELVQAQSLDAANRLVAYLKQNGYSPRAILQLTQSPLVAAVASRMEASEGIVWAIQNRERILLEAEASEKLTGRSEVRAITQVELRDNDPSVIDYMTTAYDQFRQFVSDPDWRAGKKLIFVLGHTRPDVDSVFSSISRAYLKHLELIHAGNKNTVVVPIVNTLNAEERADLERFRGDVIYYLQEVMQFDLNRVLFYNDVVGDLQGLDPSAIEIYLTDHNKLVPDQKGFAHRVRELMDHHDLNKLSQIKDQNPTAEIMIQEIGSSSTLAAGLISNPHAIKANLAKLLLAGLISDTSNLSDPDPGKVTTADTKIAETLRLQAGGQSAVDAIYDRMNERYDNISNLTDDDVLRKDFKEYSVKVEGKENKYAISSLRIGKKKEEEWNQRESGIVKALGQKQAKRNYEVFILNVGFRDKFPGEDPSKAPNQARLYISAKDPQTARDLADLLAVAVEDLQDANRQDLPAGVIQLNYKSEVLSRKKLSPVLDIFAAVSKAEYYKPRVKSIYPDVEVKSRPVILYNDWVKLLLNHQAGKEGIFRNYEVLTERGTIDYAQKEPVDYGVVAEEVKDSQMGKAALENGEVIIWRPVGGTAGRAFGYKIPSKHRNRALYMPALKILNGEKPRYLSAWEMIFAHARFLRRIYGGANVGVMSATNKDQHNIFENNLKEINYYGLNPNHVLIHPVAGIPSLNPSTTDLQKLLEGDKHKFRKSVTAYLKEIKKTGNKVLLEEIITKLKFEGLRENLPEKNDELDEKIIFPFITKVNGGQAGLFTYADGSLRYKNPSHMTVLSNAFADGALYKAWKEGFRVLVYGNDTDLGHVVDEKLLSYLYKRKEEAGVEMLALLVSKDITFTINEFPKKQNQVIARKRKVVPDPLQPKNYHFQYEIVPSGTTVDLKAYPIKPDNFQFVGGKDKLMFTTKSAEGQIQIVDIEGKPEKGGVPISINGKDVLGEAWALPDHIKQNNIPTYNPASYLIFIEDAFKAFGINDPNQFPEIESNLNKLDQLLHAFNRKINTYWEVKEEADTNEVYWVFKDGRKAEVVLNEEGKIIRSNLEELGVENADELKPRFDDREIGKDEKGIPIKKEILVELKDKNSQVVFTEESIKPYNPPRFVLQPAQLLGDLTFILNTEFVNIDRDGINTPIGYGVAKEKEDPVKYKKLMANVQNAKLDIVQDPTQKQSPVLQGISVTEEMAPSEKEIIDYIKTHVEARMHKKPRSEVRQVSADFAKSDQVAGAIRQVFSEMGLSQEPIALVYDHRLPTKAEVESVRALRHVTVSIRWDLSKFPDIIARQNELQKAGLENFAGDSSFRGRFFANLTQEEAFGSMIQSQTWRAGNRRTVVLTNRREGLQEPYLILTAEKIKQPVAAALLLALVDGNLEDLPPELRIFVTQGANRYGFREDMNVDMILNQLLIEQKTVKRSA